MTTLHDVCQLLVCYLLYSKSERKITYEQFEVAVGLLAEKKYPGVANGLERIRVKLTSGSGPSTHGATDGECLLECLK